MPDEVDYEQPIVVADAMVALFLLGVGSFIGSSFLIYCFVQFCREYSSRGKRTSHVTPLPGDSRCLNDKTSVHRLAIAGLGLTFTATAYSQSGAPPNPNGPAMVGPLKPAAPRIVDAGPLGNLEINGTFSGFGLWQGHPKVGAKGNEPTQWRGALEIGLMFWVELPWDVTRRKPMWDVLMLLATVVFFAVAIAYTNACERLR